MSPPKLNFIERSPEKEDFGYKIHTQTPYHNSST